VLSGLFDDVDERLLVECAAVEPALDGRVGCGEAEVLALRRAERVDDVAVVVPDDGDLPVDRRPF
jgi:hypothetical protein